MGLTFMVLRLVLIPVLGVVISFGVMLLVLASNVSEKLLNAEFYARIIAGEDTYNRIYDEVLVD